MLLYGDSGTGKSSSIKALLNRYKDKGLKLISLSREKIDELPKIFETVRNKGQKFIIFVDDLSFEEGDNSYKSFKSIVEGSVSAKPANTLICVTSNRRNIVREVWKDREGVDDIHLRDNLQEKRSLADRFGLTLVYPSPDKQEYLGIVLALSKKAGIDMPDDELIKEALTWEIRHGGRSGRAARQFVDYKVGTGKSGEHNR
jgi:predicted AAA+ superfamily ATPase